MGHVLARLLEDRHRLRPRAGFAGHEANYARLLAGEIDLYSEYLGTALRRFLGLPPARGAEATYRLVRAAARERSDVVWLPPYGFNNSYAVIVRAPLARELGLARVSDLAPHAGGLRLGGTEELLSGAPALTFAPGGYPGWQQTYGFAFGTLMPLPRGYGATFAALGRGEVDAIVDFPVNPAMVALDLTELADDRAFFAPYFAAPVVRGAYLAAHPQIEATLAELAGRVDNRRAAELNHAVEIAGQPPEAVAANLLRQLGLLAGGAR